MDTSCLHEGGARLGLKWAQLFGLYHVPGKQILDAPVLQPDESHLVVLSEGVQHVELEETVFIHEATVLGAVAVVSLGALARHVHADIVQMLGAAWRWLCEFHTFFLKQ